MTYLDTMLKFKPYSLMEYLDMKINKFPLFLNSEGKMLIIKDKRIEAKEPSEEVKKYGFEPIENKNKSNNNENQKNNSNINTSSNVRQMIEFFNKAVNRVHRDINYVKENKNKYKTKEKSLKIKIKMLEEEKEKEEKKEEKKEKKEEEKIEEEKKEDNNDEIYDYGEYIQNDIETQGIDPLF